MTTAVESAVLSPARSSELRASQQLLRSASVAVVASPFACLARSASLGCEGRVGAATPLKAKRSLAAVLPPDVDEAASEHVMKERRPSAPEPLFGCADEHEAVEEPLLPAIVEQEGAVTALSDGGSADSGSSETLAAALMDVDSLAGASAKALQQVLRMPSQLPSGVAAVLDKYGTQRVGCGGLDGLAEAARMHIAETGTNDTFYLYDLGEVARLHATWCDTMPRVMPFYAVKCNPEPAILATLNALGAGFDCASIQELERAAALDVPQSRIIFANPCKRPADFRYAAKMGVELTTFDCASELHKIAAGNAKFQCVLRIRCDDPEAHINLGLKYGADMQDVPDLLALAKELGLQVVGVSFHVGSGCKNVGVYSQAIAWARQAFDAAEALGFTMTLLDIGGGFTAPYDRHSSELWHTTAGIINDSIDKHFPPSCGVRIIAEPGQYFAKTSATLFTSILGQRSSTGGSPATSCGGAALPRGLAEATSEFRDYWLSDGTYGSFRIQVTVDGLEPDYRVLRSPLLAPPSPLEDEHTPCRLWGNSSRQTDCVQKHALLPRLRDGDWLMFPYAGAYTICAASNYGGVAMAAPDKVFVLSEQVVRSM